MICITDCQKAQCLIAPSPCIDEYLGNIQNLVIGALEPDTDYSLYIEDQNNEVLKLIQITSDAIGNLTFDMNDYLGFFHENTIYKVWVTILGAGLTAVEDITFGPYDTYTCVLLEFKKVSENSETLVGAATQTVTI